MSEVDTARVRELREEFDRSFAEPAKGSPVRNAPLLEVRVAGAPYLLDLAEIAVVCEGLSLTPVPSDEPCLLGVAGISGDIVAVYDLSCILGHAASRAPRWLAAVRGHPAAVAFDALEGHTEVPTGTVVAAAGDDVSASELVFVPGLSRPLIRLSVLVARLGRRRLAPERGSEST
jgi:chemotaxis signal transduction protein